ncbi:Uncharacterised protein [Mycobacteroides abscessus subsp. massiliense]|nr:Uncharacterised protein [Mycobacteroides abscessus subsp. massiliense]
MKFIHDIFSDIRTTYSATFFLSWMTVNPHMYKVRSILFFIKHDVIFRIFW